MQTESLSSPRLSASAAEPAAASWRKLVGAALLWVGLSALVYVPQANAEVSTSLVAFLGFAAFSPGLLLFAEGFKRSVVAGLLERLGR